MDDALTTADGLTLQLRTWPVERPHGSVLVVHGLGEHIGRYAQVAAHLNEWGWNVVGYDQRGHGTSEGARLMLRRFLEDFGALIRSLERAQPLLRWAGT